MNFKDRFIGYTLGQGLELFLQEIDIIALGNLQRQFTLAYLNPPENILLNLRIREPLIDEDELVMKLKVLGIVLLLLIRLHDSVQNERHVLCLADHILENWVWILGKFLLLNQVYEDIISVLMNVDQRGLVQFHHVVECPWRVAELL